MLVETCGCHGGYGQEQQQSGKGTQGGAVDRDEDDGIVGRIALHFRRMAGDRAREVARTLVDAIEGRCVTRSLPDKVSSKLHGRMDREDIRQEAYLWALAGGVADFDPVLAGPRADAIIGYAYRSLVNALSARVSDLAGADVPRSRDTQATRDAKRAGATKAISLDEPYKNANGTEARKEIGLSGQSWDYLDPSELVAASEAFALMPTTLHLIEGGHPQQAPCGPISSAARRSVVEHEIRDFLGAIALDDVIMEQEVSVAAAMVAARRGDREKPYRTRKHVE